MRARTDIPRKVLSVSQLNNTVRRMFEAELPALWIEGEISNLVRPASGHWYFSLKDDQAQIRCAMFRRANASVGRSGFHPANGDQVILKGRVGLYEPRGDYQFIAEHMEEAGSGALQRAYELLRNKLKKEGLFSAETKLALPQIPHCIGVITSATGAALQDIVNVLGRRLPMVPVVVYPVLVQGDLAASEIGNALARAEHEQRCDVLIIGRGGGSLEDLWAFNDEALARLAYSSSIPIISAVGHEIDFTILDFVADVRAPTPSAAAELATPVTATELAARLAYLHQHANNLMLASLNEQQQKIGWLHKRLQLAHPGQWVQQQQQKLDFLVQKINQSMQQKLTQSRHQLSRTQQGLSLKNTLNALNHKKSTLTFTIHRMQQYLEQKFSYKQQQLTSSIRQLNALSPLATLERGYAVVKNKSERVIKSTQQVKLGDTLSTQLHNGTIESTITSLKEK